MKNSFTLVELLIVLFITILVYSISFSFFSQQKQTQKVDINSLYQFMLSHKQTTLQCIQKCKILETNESVDFQIPDTNMSFGYVYNQKLDEIEKIKFQYKMDSDGFGENIFFSKDGNFRLTPFGKIEEIKE